MEPAPENGFKKSLDRPGLSLSFSRSISHARSTSIRLLLFNGSLKSRSENPFHLIIHLTASSNEHIYNGKVGLDSKKTDIQDNTRQNSARCVLKDY